MVKAIIGGTYDPITNAHIASGRAVHETLKTEALLIPSLAPWQKAGQIISPYDDRLKMTQLAIEDEPGLAVSDIERKLGTPSYMINTLKALIPNFETSDEVIYLFLGSDQVRNLPSWKDIEKFIHRISILTSQRNNDTIPHEIEIKGQKIPLNITELPPLQNYFKDYKGSIPLHEMSATLVRDMVKQGLAIDDYVKPKVAQHIADQKLYLPQPLEIDTKLDIVA